MSLFKKNVPLQEEVAPVMQEYTGQHPVLNFTPVSAIVKSDHLDQYMEVHPFASSEGKLNKGGNDGFSKTYNFYRDEQHEANLKEIILKNKLSGLFFSRPLRRSRRIGKGRNNKDSVEKRLWYFVPLINQDTTKEDMQNIHEKMESFDDDDEEITDYLINNPQIFDWEKGTMQQIEQYEGYSFKGIYILSV